MRRCTKIRTDCELEQFSTLKALVKAVAGLFSDETETTRKNSGNNAAKTRADGSGKTSRTPEVQEYALESRHPEAMQALIQWRRKKYSALNVPAYIVMHQKTLIQISDILPSTREELMQADGFGKAKWEQYGREILELLEPFRK